jgi:predicted O-linked N-acetylglucosamine transferase (SPINDLY family)/dTDP-glucose pyrophosphorylase
MAQIVPSPSPPRAGQPLAERGDAGRFVGILPAAGAASRLQPLRSPKELLPILYVETDDGAGLQPIAAAEFALASMYLAGVRHCFVVMSDAKPELPRYFGDGSDRNMALGYLVQPAPRGLADAVDVATPWVGDRCCCLALPDTVFSPPDALDRVCRELIDSAADLVLGVFPVANPCQLGPVRIDAGGAVLEVLEKPAATDLANSWGIAAWSPKFTRFLHQRLAADGAERHPSIGTLFNAALGDGLAVRALAFPGGEYLDAGTPQGLKRLVRTWSGASGAAAPGPAVDELLDAAAAHHRAGDLEAAMGALDAAQAARLDHGDVRTLRGALAIARDRPDDALRIVAEGALDVPEPALAAAFGGPEATAAALAALSGLLIARGERPLAATVLRTASAIAPAAVSIHVLLGWLAVQDGRRDDALARAWRALELAPDGAAGHTLLGRVLHDSGHVEDAVRAFEAALRCDPDDALAHRSLGNLFAERRDIARADEHLQRAILLDPADLDGLRTFAWFLNDTDRLERAEAVARQALKISPEDAQVRHQLAWILKRRDRAADARSEVMRALALAPEFPAALCLLAALDLAAGDAAAAERSLREALRIEPDDAEVHHVLAWALHDQRALEDAEDASRRAGALAPERPELQAQLAWILIVRGKLDEAAGVCIDLVTRHPARADGCRLMGEIEFRHRRFEAAQEWLQRALARDPGLAAAHARLGSIHLLLDQSPEAERALRAAIACDANFASAYHELAHVLERQGRFAEAEAALRTVLERKPGDAMGWATLGGLLVNDGRDEAAAAAFRRALELDDDFEVVRRQLARLHVRGVIAAREIFATQGVAALRDDLGALIADAATAYSLAEYRAIVAHAQALFPSDDLFEAARLFGLTYDVDQTLASLHAAVEPFGRRDAAPAMARRRAARRPRIAYVGNHLHREFMGYIRHHDLERLDIFVFSDDDQRKLGDPDPRLRIYRPADADLADACAAHEIDLLIDVIGPYPRPSLFDAYRAIRGRLAPVQCLWLNTFMTSGAPAYDYLIADRHLIRPGEERWFSERVLHLPHCQWFYSEPARSFEPGPLPLLANGHVTFGSANRGIKLNDAVLAQWAAVLARVPGSRLRLTSWFADHWQPRRHILEVLATHGIDAARIDVVPPVEPGLLPAFYQSVDIALDTFPFNGGLTTLEALWMGVPVASFAGDTFTARQSAGILRVLGLDDWVAPDRAGVVALAAALADDRDRLVAARAGLRERIRASPLCDGPRFARDLEALFVQMLADAR